MHRSSGMDSDCRVACFSVLRLVVRFAPGRANPSSVSCSLERAPSGPPTTTLVVFRPTKVGLHRSINGVILQFPSESTKLKGEEMKNVTFPNGPIKMAGGLHLPKDLSEDRRYVAIVCVRPAGGVKYRNGEEIHAQ